MMTSIAITNDSTGHNHFSGRNRFLASFLEHLIGMHGHNCDFSGKAISFTLLSTKFDKWNTDGLRSTVPGFAKGLIGIDELYLVAFNFAMSAISIEHRHFRPVMHPTSENFLSKRYLFAIELLCYFICVCLFSAWRWMDGCRRRHLSRLACTVAKGGAFRLWGKLVSNQVKASIGHDIFQISRRQPLSHVPSRKYCWQ
jgi:hypothetical protein